FRLRVRLWPGVDQIQPEPAREQLLAEARLTPGGLPGGLGHLPGLPLGHVTGPDLAAAGHLASCRLPGHALLRRAFDHAFAAGRGLVETFRGGGRRRARGGWRVVGVRRAVRSSHDQTPPAVGSWPWPLCYYRVAHSTTTANTGPDRRRPPDRSRSSCAPGAGPAPGAAGIRQTGEPRPGRRWRGSPPPPGRPAGPAGHSGAGAPGRSGDAAGADAAVGGAGGRPPNRRWRRAY